MSCVSTLFACTALDSPNNGSGNGNARVHDIEILARSAFDCSGCERTSLKKRGEFEPTAVFEGEKSQITGILYTGAEDATVDADCKPMYNKTTNTAVLETVNEDSTTVIP